MKKTLGILLIGTLALSSCSLVGNPAKKDVSGNLKGFSANQDLGLAIVGYNKGEYTRDGTQSQVIDKYLTGGYTLDLPTDKPYGSYRVIVFRDVNHNTRFDIGEPVLSKDNGKLLLYARMDNDYYKGVKRGWNIINLKTGELQTELLGNYDLDAQ